MYNTTDLLSERKQKRLKICVNGNISILLFRMSLDEVSSFAGLLHSIVVILTEWDKQSFSWLPDIHIPCMIHLHIIIKVISIDSFSHVFFPQIFRYEKTSFYYCYVHRMLVQKYSEQTKYQLFQLKIYFHHQKIKNQLLWDTLKMIHCHQNHFSND